MSTLQYQSISGHAHFPTTQEIGPIPGSSDHYLLDEDFLQSIPFNTDYSDDWLANMQNMQPNEQFHQTSVDYNLDNPPNMEPAGQFTEAFVDPRHFKQALVNPSLISPTQVQPDRQYPEAFPDQSLNVPTHMQLAGQPTLSSPNQSSNTYTDIPDLGQSTTSLTNQDSYGPTYTHPMEQHTQALVDYGGNTTANVLLDGQATQPTHHYGGNLQTNTPLDGQATPAPVPSSGNPQTNAPLDGQATPAPVPSSGNGSKKTRITRKSSPVKPQGKVKHPAVVEDKEIERCAGEYDFSYDDTRILLDFANARVKGIETSEPRDAPSQYIISRFEKVRRTYPTQATWPYDLPEEKIIKLLPGQKGQDRAPHKSYQDACEKRRQELDDRYNKSRQWEGPPPPKPGETDQITLTEPAIDSIATGLTAPSDSESAEVAIDNNATGLTPPGNWNFNQAEVATNTIATGLTPPPYLEPADLVFDNSAPGWTEPEDWNLYPAETATNNIPTGLTPPPTFESAEYANDNNALGSSSPWVFGTRELDEQFYHIMQLGVQCLDKAASAPTFDFGMEGIEDSTQLPQQPPFTTPIQPDGQDPLNYLANGPAAPEDIHMTGSVDPAQFPTLLPTFTPMEQNSGHLLEYSNPPAFSDASQSSDPFPLPTFTPMEQDNAGPLDNSNPPATSDVDDLKSLFEGSEGRPSPPPTSAPAEQDNTNPLPNANPPAVSANSPHGFPFDEPVGFDDYIAMVQQPEEPVKRSPSSTLPTWTPMEQDISNPLADFNLSAVTNESPYSSMLNQDPQFMSDSEYESFLRQSMEEGSGEDGMEGLEVGM